MSKEKEYVGSTMPAEDTLITLDAKHLGGKASKTANDLEPQFLNTGWTATYRGNGVIKLNINCPIIHPGSTVLIGISEYSNTASPATSRFIGSARYAVYNISPREGGVFVWMEISWGSPINIFIELLVN